jgi:DNA repair photolyase
MAATLKDRLEALRRIHEAGSKTWVSIEPYPTPNIYN